MEVAAVVTVHVALHEGYWCVIEMVSQPDITVDYTANCLKLWELWMELPCMFFLTNPGVYS